MANYYPPVGFHFSVDFIDIAQGENRFQSVSGLSVERETEEFAEGGENRFKHKLPVRTKFPNLILKRGFLVNSELIKWCENALLDFDIQPTDLIIKLLNENHEPLFTWKIQHAWPLKWEIDSLNAEENKIVIETLELSYQSFNINS